MTYKKNHQLAHQLLCAASADVKRLNGIRKGDSLASEFSELEISKHLSRKLADALFKIEELARIKSIGVGTC